MKNDEKITFQDVIDNYLQLKLTLFTSQTPISCHHKIICIKGTILRKIINISKFPASGGFY